MFLVNGEVGIGIFVILDFFVWFICVFIVIVGGYEFLVGLVVFIKSSIVFVCFS